MDAHHIFKLLSRGAKFSREHNFKSNDSSRVKVEVERVVVPDVPRKKQKDNNTITLLGTLKTETKGKKRKHSNPESDEIKKKKLKQEEINHYRNVHHISVVGKHVPEPTRCFDDFPIKQVVIEDLKNCGYVEPTSIQKQAIPIMVEGRNLLACAPTGFGKTAAFLVSIIHDLEGPKNKGFRALILCPTRELAKQTQRECVRLSEGIGFRVHIISKINKAMTQYGPSSSQKFDILITTPNRLCFLLNQEPPAISLANIQWLIVDEADKLFETAGNRNFRHQLDQILLSCTNKEKKIAMFSATYTPIVAKWCVHNMKGLIRLTVGQRNAATDSVDQELLFVGNEQGKLLAFRNLVRKGLSPPVLVFVQSKNRAEQLFNELIYDGINVDAIHADRTQFQRDNTVRSFREGKIWVLICTELMARGIDFKGINLVINYDFPPSAISYVHRVGRAGRAGRKGKAITFFTIEDTNNLRSIAYVLKNCQIPSYIKNKPRKERRKLEKAAPKRGEINPRPRYEFVNIIKRRKKGIVNGEEQKYSKNQPNLGKTANDIIKKDKMSPAQQGTAYSASATYSSMIYLNSN
ncbi:probable ATP-dependent RNA helicase DDX52 [Zophobas morio]|uniref:probable ATP-dependent RNA helicase DDX52 n=1 Tax=Zophobas morio TaxID=2755281 RepID=UPI003083B242